MTNAKRKKVILLLILGVIAYVIVWGISYYFIEGYIRGIETKATCLEIEAYMKEDESFALQYGKVLSVVWEEELKVQQMPDRVERIPCAVKVEDGKEYLVWVDFHLQTSEVQYYSIAQRKSD